jgi:N-formylglutamate amidohydrolase
VLVEVPHAGTAIPPALRDELIAPQELILRDADLFVDELYAAAPARGAALLCARLSRYVVDLNRAPDDVDLETVFDHPAPRRSQPRGVVWRVTADGRPLLHRPLDYRGLCQRLSLYHEPYHSRLDDELRRARDAHGFVILLAAHSMPSTVKRGVRDVERRADVVPGSLGRTSAHRAIIDLVDRHFRAAGLSVRHDDPYRGGYTTAHYGRPREAQHAIQIELNRALYMDERDCTRKPGDFERLQALVGDLVAHLGKLSAADLT